MATQGPRTTKLQRVETIIDRYIEQNTELGATSWSSKALDFKNQVLPLIDVRDEQRLFMEVQTFCNSLWTFSSMMNFTSGSNLKHELQDIFNSEVLEMLMAHDEEMLNNTIMDDSSQNAPIEMDKRPPSTQSKKRRSKKPLLDNSISAQPPLHSDTILDTSVAPTGKTQANDQSYNTNLSRNPILTFCKGLIAKSRDARLAKEKKRIEKLIQPTLARLDQHASESLLIERKNQL